MFCGKCGNNVVDGNFCESCGTQVGGEALAAVATTTVNNKKIWIIVGIIAAALIAIFAITQLGGGSSIVGTWEAVEMRWTDWNGEEQVVIIDSEEAAMHMTFNRDGSGRIEEFWDGEVEWSDSFTWEISGGRLHVDDGSGADPADFRVSGRRLYIEIFDESVTFQRVR